MHQHSAQPKANGPRRQAGCALNPEDLSKAQLSAKYKKLTSENRCKILKELKEIIITQGVDS